MSGVTTNYAWDILGGLPVVLQDGTNTYVYGLDLISATDGAGAQTYFLTDGLGSTTDLADGSGNSTGSYGYDVFGAIRSQTGGGSNYWLFTGEQVDGDSGLYFLRARYYDSVTGRFVGRDPLSGTPSEPSTLNRFVYVLNDPINLIDPLGLHCKGWPPRHIAHCVGSAGRGVMSCFGDIFKCTYGPRSPLTTFLEEFFFRTSGGGVINKEGGRRVLTNCTGTCKAFLETVGQSAFTIGHTIFALGTFEGEEGQRLLQHEMRHVRQYEVLGDMFLPSYFGPASVAALAECAVTWNLNKDCLHDRNAFERMAR